VDGVKDQRCLRLETIKNMFEAFSKTVAEAKMINRKGLDNTDCNYARQIGSSCCLTTCTT
jgi:hypothetical protein